MRECGFIAASFFLSTVRHSKFPGCGYGDTRSVQRIYLFPTVFIVLQSNKREGEDSPSLLLFSNLGILRAKLYYDR